jgi:hypothetical protein
LPDGLNGVLDRQSGIISGIRPHTVMSYRDWPHVETREVFRGTAGLGLLIFAFVSGPRYSLGLSVATAVASNSANKNFDFEKIIFILTFPELS